MTSKQIAHFLPATLVILLIHLGSWAAPADAAGPRLYWPARTANPPTPFLQVAKKEQEITLDEAVANARRQTNGKILSAETIRENGQTLYKIRVLTPDGRIKRLKYYAASRR
ncbi:MAG: hypothetical protein GY696_29880 [Gammaproteobacteria bacterium]|nr:hypothetical protein [Gammaproteobacteria bacterium]